MALIDAYTRTGQVRQVPEHWIGHPTLGVGLSLEAPAPAAPEPALTDLTVDKLRDFAAAVSADMTGLTKKADIIAAIEAVNTTEQPPAPVGDAEKEH